MTTSSIADLSYAELYELVYQLKQCNESAPEETRRLLQEQPEFARAIAQAQLKLGLVRERQDDSVQTPVNAVVTHSRSRSSSLHGCMRYQVTKWEIVCVRVCVVHSPRVYRMICWRNWTPSSRNCSSKCRTSRRR